MLSDLSFLNSRRFWAVVLAGIVQGLVTGGYLDSTVGDALKTILWSFVGIRTVDRFSEKVGMASK